MSVDPEIFANFQHNVEQIPHFARVTEVRHMCIFQIVFDIITRSVADLHR